MKKFLLQTVFLFLCGSVLHTQAQTAYPYFPDSSVRSNLAPVATSIANPSTFAVDLSTDFTLEVNGTANTLIKIANGITAYEYTPTSTATVRFVKRGATVYVYENAVYKTTVNSNTLLTFPPIRQAADDSVNGAGVYSPLNLMANPGFERRVSQGSATHFKDGVYWNAYNQSFGLDWSTGTTAAIRSVTGVRSEGNYSIIMHSTTRYLTQKLPALEPNTYYQISYDYWTSAPASNGGATYNILLGHNQFGNNITTLAGHTTSETETTQKTFTGIFKTPASFSGTDFWLTLYRAISKVDWIDRVTLLKTTTTNPASGITGVSGTALYVAGTAYAPLVTLNTAAGDYFEMTPFMVNPSFESFFTGWTNNGMATQTNTSFGTYKNGTTYVEKWVSAPPLPDVSIAQTISNLPKGTYTLKLAAHNITQTPLAGKPGAVAFANTANKAVTDRNEYSVDFLVLDGTAAIGFKAVNSQGNWAALDNFRLQYKGFVVQTIKDSLQVLKDSATNLLPQKMQNAVRTALTSAIDTAQGAINNAGIGHNELAAVYLQIQNAIRNAITSINAYSELQTGIDSAIVVYGNGSGNRADSLLAAIQLNQTLAANLNATLQQINAGRDHIYRAIFAYRLANASGPVPVVITDSSFARGATMAFGRSAVSGVPVADILEQGFCWSTTPAPTVLHNRTTKFISRNGNMYWLENLQPATVYYMRAYAMTRNYAVGYGNVLKVITIPRGTVTYQLNASVTNSGEHQPRIASAVASAVNYFNNLTSIQGHHLSVNYNAGTPTAEASYGGYMQFGSNASYQRTGTALHEMGHTIGVGQHSMWYGPNSPLRSGGTTGNWLGERANKVVQFLENNPAEYMRGDAVHMWPYGINGAQEDNGTDLLYIGNALIHQGLGEDGLPPRGGFATPSYTFYQEDTAKYYIKTESVNMGRNTTFLAESAAGQLYNKVIGTSGVLDNDSAAWYFRFNPATGYYQIRNAATGKYFTYQASGVNGIALTSPPTLTASHSFQLMGARSKTLVSNGGNGYYVKAYWIVRPAATLTPPVLAATITGATSAVTFINRDTAATQRWLLLSKADVDSIHIKMNQTISFGPLPQKVAGDSAFDAGATASSGLPVSYTSSNAAVATIVNGLVQINGAGTTTITATQAGNNQYKAAPGVSQTLTVVKKEQSITFNALADKQVGDSDFAPVAIASSSLPVSYTSSNHSVAIITIDGKIHIVGGGTTTITAMQGGDSTYHPAPSVTQSLNVFVPPYVIAKNIIIEVDDSGNAVITPSMVDDGSVSYNGALALTINRTSFQCSDIGTAQPLTLTGTDERGYTSADTALITIRDTKAPLFTAPANSFLCYSSSGHYTVLPITATDNCGVLSIAYEISGATTRTGTGSNASGTFGVGVSTITWAVTDVHGNSTTGNSVITVNAPLTVTIPDVYAVNQTTDNKNTLYKGYGPTFLTLQAIPAGGAGTTYSYTWSTGETSPTINVNAAGTYSVTITDAAGCTATNMITIHLIDVTCGNNKDKVMICHNGQTICVASQAVQEHLNHGDDIGTCPSSYVKAAAGDTLLESSIFDIPVLSVYPNPSKGQFMVHLNSKNLGQTSVMVLDMNGRVVTQKVVTSTGSSQVVKVDISDKAKGLYLVKVVNADGAKTQKVILQ